MQGRIISGRGRFVPAQNNPNKIFDLFLATLLVVLLCVISLKDALAQSTAGATQSSSGQLIVKYSLVDQAQQTRGEIQNEHALVVSLLAAQFGFTLDQGANSPFQPLHPQIVNEMTEHNISELEALSLIRENRAQNKRRGQVSSAAVSQNYGLSRILVLNIAPGTDIQQLAARISAAKNEVFSGIQVESAQSNFQMKPTAGAITPQAADDQYFGDQWGLTQMDVPTAWNYSDGNSDVVIAVLDTEINPSHPDLAGNIWRNNSEIPNDGIDNDANGFVDDVNGWDFVASGHPVYPCYRGEDCSGEDNNTRGYWSHGTHVAGVAAATSNNATGVSGVCQNCRIMPLRIGFAAEDIWNNGRAIPVIFADTVARAIRYAVENGADVINLSFGGFTRGEPLESTIAWAAAEGVIIIGGAGNDNSPNPFYPAAYPDVIAVAANDSNLAKTAESNYGSWVDIAAPGKDIVSTSSNISTQHTYRLQTGTSMAAPHVAGLAGLIISVGRNTGNELSAADVKGVLLRSVNSYQNPAASGFPISASPESGFGVAIADRPLRRSMLMALNAFCGPDAATLVPFTLDQAIAIDECSNENAASCQRSCELTNGKICTSGKAVTAMTLTHSPHLAAEYALYYFKCNS